MNDEQLFSGIDNRWTRKEIEFNGFSLSYLEGGCSSGKTILFLHGWGVSTEPYQDCLNALARRYKVIAPDLPGFGRSPCSVSLSSYQTYANCIFQLVQRLSLECFHLMGHSFGGGVALALAATIPQQVESAIAINSTGIPLISLPDIIKRRFAEFPQQLAQLRWQVFSKIMQVYGHNLIFRSQHLIEGAKIALNEDIRPWLSDISCPCLILWGEKDYFTPISIGYGLVEAIPNSRLQVVPAAYHEWCMMQPETIADISFDFFKRVESLTQPNYESTKA